MKVDVPAPGTPVIPTRIEPPVCGIRRVSSCCKRRAWAAPASPRGRTDGPRDPTRRAGIEPRADTVWLFGLVLHAGLVIGAFYYVPLWPDLLAVPLAVANLYSLLVLAVHHNLWTAGVDISTTWNAAAAPD